MAEKFVNLHTVSTVCDTSERVSYIVRKGDCAILHKNPSYFA